jgi:hypothetical protein
MLLVFTRFLAGVTALPCLLLSAETPAPRSDPSAEVAVRNVRFERVREQGGWLEAGVHVAVAPSANGARHADRVRVALAMAYETEQGNETTLRCYTAVAEAITLPVGTSVIRFYLPPEVVARDRVRVEALHWQVEIEQGGRAVPSGGDGMSTSLRNPERLRGFKARVERDAPGNRGILVPQYLSPFAHDPRRPAPAFVRRETPGP